MSEWRLDSEEGNAVNKHRTPLLPAFCRESAAGPSLVKKLPERGSQLRRERSSHGRPRRSCVEMNSAFLKQSAVPEA